MPKKPEKTKLKKVEERFVAHIIYDDSIDAASYDTFEIIKGDYKDHIMVKWNEVWRSKASQIRYFEELLNILKTEL